MSLENPLDARIERAIESELATHRDKDLTVEEHRQIIAHNLRRRLQAAGVMADVKRVRDKPDEKDDPMDLDPYSPQ